MEKPKVEIEIVRHSLSHVLASAVVDMFPEARLGIGPAIENGFYYDFDLPRTLIPEDLPILEEGMRKIIKADLPFERVEIPTDEAIKDLKKSNQKYKLELVEDLKKGGEKNISLYKTGGFIDLCKGPHVKSTSELSKVAFKLDKIAGAYWKGSEKNQMMQRVYALAFENKKALDEYLVLLEEAKKRDHRKLGQQLDLFSFHDEAPGFPFWHPKGMILREALMKPYDELHRTEGYQTISTPILLSEELWHRSGHWDHYKDNMYFTKIDDRTYAIKPMNCPGSILIYNTKLRSYRDLPIKLCEKGEVHRHEPSGTLHGLFRVRAFRQDDSHIFAREDQVADEIKKVVNLTLSFYEIFNFSDVKIELSTRPDNSIGTDEVWNKSESIMKNILSDLKLKFKINEGDGAFYGPKIDFHINDSLGRSWQCGTIQLDFSMPERFDLSYTDKNGSQTRPVMIHRTVIGSIQRFVGILIEHYAGAFPAWLAPVQAVILPISEKQMDYAKEVKEKLEKEEIRVELDERNESIGKKIRDAQMQKIPYMLVVGEREVMGSVVAVRENTKGDLGTSSVEDLIKQIKKI